jgi:hypothetical protein
VEDGEKIHDMLRDLDLYDEWLYNDTCHSEFQGVSLEEQEKYLHERAKKDIDFLLDRAVPTLKEKVSELKRAIDRIRRLGK